MLKARSKKLAILLTLAMLATLFVGVGAANAATTYSALTAPTVVPTTPASNAALGTIIIDIGTIQAGAHSALISLPTDYDIDGGGVPVLAVVKEDTVGNITIVGVTVAGYAKNECRIDFTAAAVDTGVKLSLTFPGVTVPSDASGDIVATITGLAGQLSSGSVVIGKASTGEVTVSLVKTVTITEAGTTGNAVKINVKENATNAVDVAANTVKFKLPKGFTWNLGTAAMTRINDGTDVITTGEFTLAGNGTRTLAVNRNAAVSPKSIFRIEADINVDESQANFGAVEVTVSGTSSITPSSLEIGTYSDYSVSFEVTEVKTIKAGRAGSEIGKFKIKEDCADSLYTGRTITMKLPAGAKWATVPAPAVSGGGLAVTPIASVGTDGRTIKFTVTNAAGGGKGTITFDNVEVDLAVDFSGDVAVEVGGSAGAAGTIVAATAVSPITATAEPTEVKIGVQNQAAGDIVIAESVKEALKQGDLVLTAPVGVEFAEIPTVAVTEGDLEIDDKAISVNGRVLTIPISAISATASTITISDVYFTVDRTVPEGPINIEIAGDAVDEVNDPAVTWALVRPFYTVPVTGQIFPQNDKAAEVVNATTVTPAPGETTVNEASFVIGSSTYELNGEEKSMDVAPYIKNDRTYMPLRYVAYALGIDDNNILWDGVARTVTLMKGDKVVQIAIGSKTMLINGAAITMDVAPEITSDRTMLPIRFVAQAFGATVGWDAATQTVTIK